jgi:hypothetical protein
VINPTETSGSPAHGALRLVAGLSVCALLLGVGCGPWDGAEAQSIAAGSERPSFPGTGLPLNRDSGSPVPKSGTPLGSVELATPGISPALPSSNAATPVSPDCSSANRPSGALFDGGGLSVGRSVLCGPRLPRSVQEAAQTRVSHTELPLGSTELPDSGLSAVPTFPLPSASTFGLTPTNKTAPCPPLPGASTATPASSGC